MWLREAGIVPSDIALLQRAASGAQMAIVTVTSWEEAHYLWEVCWTWWVPATASADAHLRDPGSATPTLQDGRAASSSSGIERQPTGRRRRGTQGEHHEQHGRECGFPAASRRGKRRGRSGGERRGLGRDAQAGRGGRPAGGGGMQRPLAQVPNYIDPRGGRFCSCVWWTD